MNLKAIYAQAPECLLENMDGELLLYNPINATTLHLNGSSAVVWEMCDGQRSVDAIVTALQEAFPEQAEQISNDVNEVVGDLLQQAALVEVAQS